MESDQAPTPRRRMVIAIVLLMVLAPLAAVAFLVDDWSRDLNTNTAATSPRAKDELLRPLDTETDLETVGRSVEKFLGDRANWSRVDGEPLPSDSPIRSLVGEPLAVWRLVRSTALWRFKDDVWLVVEDRGGGALRLHGDSRSRLGKGDLGQNPRNLRELFGFLQDSLQ